MNPRLAQIWAPYMDWAKSHPRPRFDLCGSNLAPCTIDDLPGAREALEPNGDNDHGYAPLIESIAGHYSTTTDRVALASGASGANFLVLAALLAPGDEGLIEKPAYDPLPGAARLLGARVTRFERRFETGFAVDAECVDDAITPKTRLVVITHPHNPALQRARSILEPGLAKLAAFVNSRDELESVPPAGGTVGFPRLRDHDDAEPFIKTLLEQFDTAVVTGRLFDCPEHFRVAFSGDADVLEGGLDQLGKALENR